MPDLLREEFVQAIHERADLEFKGKLEQAFVAWYIEAEFGRTKWDFTDDAGDGGIDAVVWRPGERPSVVIIQSKFSERVAGSLLSEAAYKGFSRVVDAFYNGDQEFDDFISSVREDARRPYRKAQAALEDVGNWLAEKKAFRLITTSRKRARRLEDSRLPSAAFQYADDILELYSQYRKGQTPTANDLVLEVGKKLGYRDPRRRVTSYLFNARVSDFRRYFEQNDVARLVARNIRYNLGGRVGKEIRKTYEGHPHDFWYVHNGITIVCDDCREGRSRVTLENPSVVNGAQTLYAISGSSRKTSPAFMATRVIVRAARKGGHAGIPEISTAEINYCEACVSFCDRASVCRAKALAAGDGAILGDDVARFLGTIPLQRALALMEGAAPKTPTEGDLKRRIDDIEGLRDLA